MNLETLLATVGPVPPDEERVLRRMLAALHRTLRFTEECLFEAGRRREAGGRRRGRCEDGPAAGLPAGGEPAR